MDSLLEVAEITASILGGDRFGTSGLSIICASGEQNVVNLGLLVGLRLMVLLRGGEVNVASALTALCPSGLLPLCSLQLEPPVCCNLLVLDDRTSLGPTTVNTVIS